MNNIGYLLSYAWRKSKLLFFTTSLRYIVTGVLPLIGIIGIGSVVGELENQRTIQEIMRTIILYLSVNLSISLIKIGISLLDNLAMRKASDIVQMDYMRDCVFINYHYVEDKSILNLKNKSMRASPVWFLEDFFSIFLYIVQFVGVAYLFVTLSPWFLLLIILTSSVSVCINFRKQKTDFEYETAQSEDERKLDYLYRTMSDYRYAKEIRINSASHFLLKKYEVILKKLITKTEQLARKKLGMDIIVAIITVFQTILMYIFFSWQVTVNQISIADYTVLLSATTLLVSILIGFFGCIGSIRKTLSYTDLFREYRDLIKLNSNIELNENTCHKVIDWEHAEIQLSHVSFSYPNNEKKILDDIDITIKPGEHIAIVGLNGSGKTTLVKLLLRLYDPTSGAITVNGVNIKDIPHGEYVRNFGVVLQDFCIFAYSIRENIVFDNEYNEQLCRYAIEESGLSKKVRELNNGLNTSLYKELDDNGVELSGGEGQKLSIARAMYKNANVMIMDEPTSTLDPIAECEMFEKMSEISAGKSTVLISHRLSSTLFCDRIFVISDGKVIESGNHDSLMKTDGVYADLFKSQAKYYEMETTDR